MRPLAVSPCTSDIHTVWEGAIGERTDMILGHEAVGEIVKVGNTSRKMVFEARKVVAARPDISPSAADVLKEPVVVCRASGTCVVKKRTSASLRAANGIFGPFRTRKASRDAKTAGRSAGERNGRCDRKFSANRSEQV